MKILGIDDNQDLLDLCDVALTSEGHEYTGVNTGKEGVQILKDEQYDMVLLDLSMPDFSGVDVVDALVEAGIMKKQKVVIFTASSATEKEYGPLIEKGAHSIVKKPLDVDILIETIQKVASEG
jgi:two-component system, OmpR family, response regulator